MRAAGAMVVVVLVASSSMATGVVPPRTWAEMVDLSDAVVLATVAGAAAESEQSLPRTIYRLSVAERVKGNIADRFELDVPGGATADGRVVVAVGMPRLEVGGTYLLCLQRAPEGRGKLASVVVCVRRSTIPR